MRENNLDSHTHFGDWVDQFFQRALQWVLAQPAAVGTSKVGAMNNALSQLRCETPPTTLPTHTAY